MHTMAIYSQYANFNHNDQVYRALCINRHRSERSYVIFFFLRLIHFAKHSGFQLGSFSCTE